MKFSDSTGREVTVERLGRLWFSVKATTPGPPGAEWVRTCEGWCTFSRLGAVRSAKRWLRKQHRLDVWRTKARYGLLP